MAASSNPRVPVVDLSRVVNPVIPGHYADPELRWHDGRFYLFPTVSRPFDEQTYLEAFVSDDLCHWENMGRVLEMQRDVGWSRPRCLWAPSVVSRYGTWFMYFSAGDGEGIGLGVWHRFEKRFVEPLRRPLIGAWPFGAQPIDANAFIDDDGRAYLYFGGHGKCVMVELNDDMCSLKGGFHLVTPEHYVEGPFMFKRRGLYYFMWSEGNWGDDTYGVAYAISDSPMGPFRRVAQVLSVQPGLASGAGHNSVLQIPGTDEWVICYHRRPWGVTERDARVTCIDRLRFRADDTIVPVVMT